MYMTSYPRTGHRVPLLRVRAEPMFSGLTLFLQDAHMFSIVCNYFFSGLLMVQRVRHTGIFQHVSFYVSISLGAWGFVYTYMHLVHNGRPACKKKGHTYKILISLSIINQIMNRNPAILKLRNVCLKM